MSLSKQFYQKSMRRKTKKKKKKFVVRLLQDSEFTEEEQC
jgi:hypothetical protein